MLLPILKTVIYIASSGIMLYALWIGAVTLLGGDVSRISYEESDGPRIAVIVCARNEEKVIGQLLMSLKKQNYPADRFKVFVVAHNCTDATARVAEEHGACVFIRSAPEEKRKAPALQYGLDRIREEYGDLYTHFVVFDADCLVHRDFLKEIGKAFASGADAASGYFASKNFSDSTVSRLAGTMYHTLMHSSCIPQNNLGLPVNVYGSGYGARMDCGIRFDGMVSLVEDFELSTLFVIKGKKAVFVPAAVFYAEMPVKLNDALKQRLRWSMGDTQCFRRYFKELLKKLPSLGMAGFKQFMDLIMNPLVVMTFAGSAAGILVSVHEGTFRSAALFLSAAAAVFCTVFFIGSVRALKLERIPLKENMHICLLIPFWIFLSAVYAVDTVFRKDVEWAETKRTSFKNIEDMEN